MNKPLIFIVCLLICLNRFPLSAQQFVANYDESKVPAYTLSDPLIFNNGDKVRNVKEWEKRRAEILKFLKMRFMG